MTRVVTGIVNLTLSRPIWLQPCDKGHLQPQSARRQEGVFPRA